MKKILNLNAFLFLIVPLFIQVFQQLLLKDNFKTNIVFQNEEMMSQQHAILINEIMEDATLEGNETLGLPAEEYVELFNRSQQIINLEGFTFSDGSKIAVFPPYLMQPNTYLVIGKTSADALETYSNFLGLPNFPTLSSAENLVLKNEWGDVVDIVNYTQDWYQNTTAASGGYSLERIDPNQPCLGAINWKGATAFIGGTPGKENSVLGTVKTVPLNFIRAYPQSTTQVLLTFDQAVQLESLLEITNYTLSNNAVAHIFSKENLLNEVVLELEKPLLENEVLTITLTANFEDCLGIPIEGKKTQSIALPVLPKAKDLVINELLFNPKTGGVDFVELYNRSENILDLNDLLLANQFLERPQVKPIHLKQLIFPKEYAVFTERPLDIRSRYEVKNPNVLYEQDLPTLGDKMGNISILIHDSLETIFIDVFDYTDDWHNPLLNDKNGVSLERISPELPTQSEGNWHSAAASVGYATPTFQNSQQASIATEQMTLFTLSNNRISPDGDGFEDVLQVEYATEKAGFSATLHIYDAAGRLIKKLAQNELLAKVGSFKWDGTTMDGEKATMGIYVLWISYVNLDGSVGQQKETVVVAQRF